ncbi:MAG TPA: hypothetical protein VKH45_14685, partial [Candidatus Acidoferrum sp.]|nr:hypothetical protein [Candidatus Acidoferrum sp.]
SRSSQVPLYEVFLWPVGTVVKLGSRVEQRIFHDSDLMLVHFETRRAILLCLLATSLFLARLPGVATKLESQPAVPPTTRDIAPILYEDCASCHHASEPGAHAASGQFALVSYEEVKQRADEIRSVTG